MVRLNQQHHILPEKFRPTNTMQNAMCRLWDQRRSREAAAAATIANNPLRSFAITFSIISLHKYAMMIVFFSMRRVCHSVFIGITCDECTCCRIIACMLCCCTMLLCSRNRVRHILPCERLHKYIRDGTEFHS